MSLYSLRPALRRGPLRRHLVSSRPASSTSNAAATAKETASNLKSKAQAGASNVAAKAQAGTAAAKEQAGQAMSSAQERASQALGSVQRMAGGVGDRMGSMLGGYREPIAYNLSVFRELLKQVYVGERLAPPSLSSISTAYSTMFNRAKDVNYWKELGRSGGWAKVGIYAVEAYGIFKIGEMLGRRSVVGYSLN